MKIVWGELFDSQDGTVCPIRADNRAFSSIDVRRET